MNLTTTTLSALSIGVAALAVPAWADDEVAERGAFAEAGQAVEDGYIVGRLNSAYALNEHLNPFKIDVDADNGVVTLRGTVNSEVERDLAMEIAKSVAEVREVESELEVVSDYEPAKAKDDDMDGFVRSVGDASLTAKVKTKLLVNQNVGGMSVDVDTEDKVVTLEGEVDSEAESDLIERIAANTEGVEEVRNRLEIASN